jgi:hypothetical protein
LHKNSFYPSRTALGSFLKEKLLLVCYSVHSSENESYTEISLVHHSKNIGTSESIEKYMKPLRENENPTA